MAMTTPGVTVVRPTSLDEAARMLRDSRGAVLFRGAGTKLTWGCRPRAADIVLQTAGLDRLLSHNPGDLTVAVEAGMPLRTLQHLLAPSGQWLALDPPTEHAGATLGGLLSTGDSGPRRLRYGALRDLVIGVTLVLADGTVARAGGHVIKNVAGYDLGRLWYGSLGTLGLVAELVLRVHPRAATSATVVAGVPVATATRRTLELLAGPAEPSAVDWVGDPDAGSAYGRLAIRFEGSAPAVAAQVDAMCDLLESAETLVGDAEAALWREFAAARRAEPGGSAAFAGTLPGRLDAVAEALHDAGTSTGVQVRLASHSALGLHTAHFAGAPQRQVEAFYRWRRAVLALGGTVLLRDRPAEVDATVDAVGPPPSAVGLLRALKSRLDPAGRCAPGRLGVWL